MPNGVLRLVRVVCKSLRVELCCSANNAKMNVPTLTSMKFLKYDIPESTRKVGPVVAKVE